MRLLVTGGAGFIGSNFIRYWLSRHSGDEIVNLDLLTYAGDPRSLADVEEAYPSRYRLERGDIGDLDAVGALMARSRPDVVVNFAAESHNSRAVTDPAAFMRTNALGTQMLLEAARRSGVGRFHQISTCEVYGELELDSKEAFHESSPYRARTPYSASKAAADLIVRAYHETFGLPVTISNCCNNYGPWQYPEKVIPVFITRALRDAPLPLYRQSHYLREWVHVEDHCAAIELILERGAVGETYNVGGGDERSIEDVADLVLAACGKPSTLKTYVDARPGHDRRYLLDHTKISRELGWRPRTPFAQGLAATVEWYRDHVSWWEPKLAAGAVPNEDAWREVASSPPRR
jgi:dTDP-glucose 4,6-dehydratase